MLHKILIAYLALVAVAKSGTFAYLFIMGSLNLPIPVLVGMGILVLLIVVVLGKEFLHTARRRDYFVFFLLYILMTLCSLFYTAVVSPLRVSFIETILTGTFTDIIVAVGFIMVLLRGRNYVQIKPDLAIQEKQKQSKHKV